MNRRNTPLPTVGIIGIPYDGDSSYLPGCRKGPDSIRSAMACSATNQVTESGIDLQKHPRLQDLGDLDFSTAPNPRVVIEQGLDEALKRVDHTLSLGGDHSITYPILKSYYEKYGPINVLQLDAHPDLYDQLDNNRFSHACPFARAHEAGLIKRHVQLGIRTLTPHQKAQAERFGVEIPATPTTVPAGTLEFSGAVYVTLDLDVLDPAFAPGVNHYEPGGMSVRDVLNILQRLNAPLLGADIVELNPERDVQHMTAHVAAKFMKEMLGIMLGDR